MANKNKSILFERFADYLIRRNQVRDRQVRFYVKWVQAAYDYAGTQPHRPLKKEAETAFLHEMKKGYELWQVKQARYALSLYRYYLETNGSNCHSGTQHCVTSYSAEYHVDQGGTSDCIRSDVATERHNEDNGGAASQESVHNYDKAWRDCAEKIRECLRLQHKSYRTEQAYIGWIRRFYQFLQGTDPGSLTADEARRFLSNLAVEQNVSSSTQNQALNALLFFYRHALDQELGDVGQAVRAPKKERLPVVLSENEVKHLLAQLKGEAYVMAALTYGAGLRLAECTRLRVHDVDLERCVLTVRGGKRDKDRQTVLPGGMIEPLKQHFPKIKEIYDQDRKDQVSGVSLPKALARKYPNAGTEWGWFWLFPSDKLSVDPRSKTVRRHHVAPMTFQRYVKEAANAADIAKHVTVHTLRHSFATHLVEKGYDIRTIQELLGHSDVRTTMVYTHIASRNALGIRSPLDE